MNPRELVIKECEPLDVHFESLRDCASQKVLDIGYGPGYQIAYFLLKGYEVLAIDKDVTCQETLLRNLNAADVSSEKLKPQVMDIRDVPFERNQYAAIILSHVLHFLQPEEAQSVLSKAAESVANKGFMFIRVHHDSHPFRDHPEYRKYFSHFFSKQEIESHFSSGFRLLHSAEVFGVLSQKSLDALYQAEPNPPDYKVNESWKDIEYLYQRIS
jgi:SAM-dependent methyltransferase